MDKGNRVLILSVKKKNTDIGLNEQPYPFWNEIIDQEASFSTTLEELLIWMALLNIFWLLIF